MEHTHKPLYETTTKEGTHVKVDAPDIPASLEVAKEKAEQALKENPLPTNEDIDRSLEDAKKSIREQRERGQLDAQGKLLAKDAEDILDTTSKFIHEKNKDDKLQRFFEDTREAVKDTQPLVEEAKKLKEGEVQYKGRNIQAEVIKEKEVLKKKGEKIQEEAKGIAKELQPEAQKVQQDTQQLLVSLKNFFWTFLKSEDFRRLTAEWIAFIQFLTTQKIKEQAKKIEAKEGEATANIAKAVEEGLQEPPKPTDQDILEQKTRDKFNELLDRIQEKPEYQQALRDLTRLLDILRDKLEVFGQHLREETKEVTEDVSLKAKQLGEEVKGEIKEAKTEHAWVKTDNFWKALYDARDIIAEFTGRKELDEFLDTFWNIYISIRDDEDLNKWFWDFRNFVDNILNNPEEAKNEEKKRESNELFNRGRGLLYKEKWRNQFDLLSTRFNVLIENIKTDTTTQEFGDKIKKFAQDAFLNRQGYPDIYVMEDSLIQLKNLLVPMFKQQLAQIKIGKVEFHNETYDVSLENIGFSGSFLPEHIDFHMRNDSHLDTTDSSKDMMRQILQFRISNIKPEFHNFKFFYRRKSFPKIEDWGVADMKLAGHGGVIQVTWVLFAQGGEKPIARLAEVKCEIDKLELHVVGEKTHHDILDKMLLPFVTPTIKNKICTAIEDLLRMKLLEMNAKVNEFFQSRPIETLKEKTNEVLKEGTKRLQEHQKSISAI